MKIDITGLSKESVIIALFENVYGKSAIAKSTWMRIADQRYFATTPLGPAPVGLDSVPSEYQVKQILAQQPLQPFIDYIGPVMFKIDFSGNEIDASQYDIDHATASTPGVLTATACIDRVKENMRVLAEAAAQLRFVTDALKERIGTPDLICDEFEGKTIIMTGGDYYSGPLIRLERSITQIHDRLVGPTAEAFLADIKEQYDRLIDAEKRATTQRQFVINTIKATVGATDLRCTESEGKTTIRIGQGYAGPLIRLESSIAEIHGRLVGPEREAFLADIKGQYNNRLIEAERRANPQAVHSFLSPPSSEPPTCTIG